MRGTGRDRIRKDTGQWSRRHAARRRRVSIHRISIHRPRKARVPVSSIESSIPRDQMPYSVQVRSQNKSVHTAARPADRTSMAEILIRDIREAAISSAITPIKDDLLKERQELQRQQSFSEPYQAES